ncbi:ankyrin repeat domain-containing protein [Mesorhizobium sp. WSM2239]|uniref:Ankyrin repeat domain-containing protein n=2 Tax=unclassified Mesorhizobium TaxID=325217 RepID=A0AAU8DHV5_9HYPH
MRAGMLLLICFCLIPMTSQAAAIHDAAKKGDIAAIAAALDAGANVNESDGLAAPLHYAINRQRLDAAKLLIERGADVNAVSKIGGTPLMAAVAKNRFEFITLLLAHGANPNSTAGKQTPLHLAVKRGCLDCVKALVEAGADVNARTADSFARTPIHLARFYEHSEISDYLMAHGVVLPKPAPIVEKLVAADVEKGRIYFGRNCDGCHANEPGKGGKTGPNLWEVVGRDRASVPEFNYSKTLRDWEGAWTYEDLNTFLYDPLLTTPGVLMEISGVPDETERVNLIAYLRTLSDKPIPLP